MSDGAQMPPWNVEYGDEAFTAVDVGNPNSAGSKKRGLTLSMETLNNVAILKRTTLPSSPLPPYNPFAFAPSSPFNVAGSPGSPLVSASSTAPSLAMSTDKLVEGNGAFTSEHETRTNALIEDNLQLINQMRENLIAGKIQFNLELMQKFHSNIQLILKVLKSVGGLVSQMPPLPVKMNTYFFATTNNNNQVLPFVQKLNLHTRAVQTPQPPM